MDLLVASPEEIRRYARGALVAAGALNVTPAPLVDIEAAAGLLPAADLFTQGEQLPPGMREIVAKLARKVMGGLAITEKRVYLHQELPPQRRRFVHGHEIGHRALPWQEQAYFADTCQTLHPRTRDAMEQEANVFAADLLFGLDRFTDMADSWAPGIVVPMHLAGTFQTSVHSALRRYTETSHHRIALLAMGRQPRHGPRGPYLPVITAQSGQSASFTERYGAITQLAGPSLPFAEHPAIAAAYECSACDVIEDSEELILDTKRGLVHFQTEVFDNGRLKFVLVMRRTAMSGRRLHAA